MLRLVRTSTLAAMRAELVSLTEDNALLRIERDQLAAGIENVTTAALAAIQSTHERYAPVIVPPPGGLVA